MELHSPDFIYQDDFLGNRQTKICKNCIFMTNKLKNMNWNWWFLECAIKHISANNFLQNIIDWPYCLFLIAIQSHENVYPTTETFGFWKNNGNLCFFSEFEEFSKIFIVYILSRETRYLWGTNNMLNQLYSGSNATRVYILRALKKLLTSVHLF